ncbi:DNA phosphorothioation system sulfurtransferase DndC [Thiocystis violacea]|uniref:DNA phosphorothioation system sulfurtransferase DndC n=1 Tax=Thiocystis violacea TaxID=13725 RepID=UPI001A91285B|nr:DNA phosphorothioation system sulfurtransferase DndC [Thiocystis violacea]
MNAAPEDVGPSPKERAYARLEELYRQDRRPWVVAFSGGKDSTALLQLVYSLLLDLDDKDGKPVFVIASDTGVEAPNVSAYLADTLAAIRASARDSLPNLTVHLVKPEVDQTFWSKLIGQGYPSPTRWFRWCTTNMKIKPSRRLIEGITRRHGSVVLLLGTRIEESAERGRRINAREQTARGLNPHHEIPNALVATPIVDWTTDDVWEYLVAHNPPPWDGNHDFLLNLYRQASGGECPVVLDLSTPSCGGSRFGCWTCTVVKEDKSMQGFIASGEERFEPLKRFRDELKAIREDNGQRMPHRKDGSKGPGPFRPEVRQRLLGDLLALELKVGEALISDEEIAYIQTLWSADFDLKESALEIASLYGRRVDPMSNIDLPPLEQEVLDDLLAERDLDPELVDKLLGLVLHEYPDLRVWGSKAALQRDIEQAIQASARNFEAAETSQ